MRRRRSKKRMHMRTKGVTTKFARKLSGVMLESVKDEQLCEHDPEHHWALVELLNEREADSQLR